MAIAMNRVDISPVLAPLYKGRTFVRCIQACVILLFVLPTCLWGQIPFTHLLGDNLRDWSQETSITIPQPDFATINLCDVAQMPLLETDSLITWAEVYDGHGNYFKKRALLTVQGNSSRSFPKKNYKILFYNEEGKGKTDLSLGDWITQSTFHLKAYYNDYFRGVAVVGYQLYDEIALDRGRMWQRAGLSNPDPKARCYPDGFPCAIYVNGDFYGIYAWQLKKDQKNMNQKKETATHIHLDGIIDTGTFWNTKIDWSRFEVRNPRGLYSMDGSLYDGDYPTELIDETSPFYNLPSDDVVMRQDKQRTAQVKHCIETFSYRCRQMGQLWRSDSDKEVLRDTLAVWVDIPSLIDYYCFHFVVDNCDGFWKNWQWFTYDGVKWFVAPYDLDFTFGNDYTGYVSFPAEWNYAGFTYKNIPMLMDSDISTYYWEDVKQRYADLRTKGIISPAHIKDLVAEWQNRVGADNYAKEWEMWSDSRCIRQTVCAANWSTSDDWTDFDSLPVYDPSVTYHEGDKCTMARRIWTATGTTTGVKPYRDIGYTDSYSRVCDWIDRRIELMDDFLEYSESDAIVDEEALLHATVVERYNMNGQRVFMPQRGVNILRMSDGTVRKVLVK